MPRYLDGIDNPEYGRDHYHSSSHQRGRTGRTSSSGQRRQYSRSPNDPYGSYGSGAYVGGHSSGYISAGGHYPSTGYSPTYAGVPQYSSGYLGPYSGTEQLSAGYMGAGQSSGHVSSGRQHERDHRDRHGRKSRVAVTRSSRNVHNTVGDYSYRDTKGYYAENPKYQHGYEYGNEYEHIERRRSTMGSPACILLGAIVIIAILAAIIVPTLFLTVLKKDDSSSGSSNGRYESVEIRGSLRLEDGVYTSALSNPFSSAFKAKEADFCSDTERAMQSRNALGTDFNCQVLSFREGSIVVNYRIDAQFQSGEAPTQAALEQAFQTAITAASFTQGNLFNSEGLDRSSINFNDPSGSATTTTKRTTTTTTTTKATTTSTTTTTQKPTVPLTTTKRPVITTTPKPTQFSVATTKPLTTFTRPTTTTTTTKKPTTIKTTTKAVTGPTQATTTQAPCLDEKTLQTESDTVTITSPGYPSKYQNDKVCTYNINGKNGYGLHLKLNMFSLENERNCEYDSVHYLDANGNDIRDVMCGVRTGESLVLDVTFVQVVFSSDASTRDAGFEIEIALKDLTDYCGGSINAAVTDSFIKSPEYPNKYPNDLDCTWTLTAPAGKKILLEITDLDVEEDASCAYDYLKIDESDKSESQGLFCGSSFEDWPMISYTNEITVKFYSDVSLNGKGFQLKYRALECGSHLSTFPGTVTSPDHPSNYANDLSCSWLIDSVTDAPMSLTMNLLDIHAPTASGSCGGDSLTITERISATRKNTLGPYCRDQEPSLDPTEGSTLLVEFVSDASDVGQGFSLGYDTLDTTCGGQHTITAGQTVTVKSPLHPLNYPNKANCVWTITGPSGSNLQLSFDSAIDIEEGSGCPYDRLEMRNGATVSSQMNAILCGKLSPRTLQTTGNQMYLKFTSDDSVNGGGFDITVEVGTGNPTSGACAIDTTPDSSNPHTGNAAVQCGKPAIAPTLQNSKIIRGTEATPHSWPWQIMLEESTDSISCSYRFICGGSIVADRWILTAAHCLELDDPGAYRVIVGKHNVKAEDDHTYEKTIQVIEFFIHEDYDDQTFDNDIALLKLKEQIEFTDQVSPLCVTDTPAPDNTDCYATGWGDTKGTGDSNYLLQALLPTINRNQCKTNPGYNVITANMFCAGYEINLRDTCQGDSGGPLMCKLPGESSWKLFGVTSWGYGCGASDAPGVYTEVAIYDTWITQKTGGDVSP